MSFLWRLRHPLIRARTPLIPRGTRGVSGQFDHLPLPLPYNIKDGLGNFLPPRALEAVAMEYQLGLLARLTEEVRQTDEEGNSVPQIVISTSPHREKNARIQLRQSGSQQQFLLGAPQSAISDHFMRAIQADHGGLEQLKSTVSAAALGMFTSGWIWFVSDKNGSTSVLPTFGPGTLLVRSRTYMAQFHPTLYQDVPVNPLAWDRDTQYVGKYLAGWGADDLGMVPPLLDPKQLTRALTGPPRGSTPLKPRFLHTSARQSAEKPWEGTPNNLFQSSPSDDYRPPKNKSELLNASGDVLYPLFCVSVQEHAWITAGYGVWGKEAWLREFWNVLNWKQVDEAYNTITASTQQSSQ
ncbi:Manganese/iron superoxide dismutase [Mycena epipterygia]|nr:Manganese/iron superoxide dismutase [Mycena epipterygia]